MAVYPAASSNRLRYRHQHLLDIADYALDSAEIDLRPSIHSSTRPTAVLGYRKCDSLSAWRG